MKRNLNGLLYSITVAREGSLTRAEAKPGGATCSQPGNIGAGITAAAPPAHTNYP